MTLLTLYLPKSANTQSLLVFRRKRCSSWGDKIELNLGVKPNSVLLGGRVALELNYVLRMDGGKREGLNPFLGKREFCCWGKTIGGSKGAPGICAPPPSGSKLFQFNAVFGKKLAKY